MSIFDLSIRERLEKMSKAELIEQRQLVFEARGVYRHLRDSEEKLQALEFIEHYLNKPNRGRPRKPAESKCSEQVKINITPQEKTELEFRQTRLGYKHLSTYMRDITLNLMPDLQVSSIERPEFDEEFLESIYEDIQFSSVQLMHALQENVLDKETVNLIIEYLSLIQQKLAEREQQELGEYNSDFALMLANRHLTQEQLQKLADFKELREEATYM
ncbi:MULTISPECIES: hypothetical protein [Vibrio]|uniref:hypothetical protein n=1 Tax=Vibrio TaxID=662 RepID=UPI001BD5984D|nr:MULTISPECIES: hypothetical protein [Vibrio]MBS9993470.1 hypothetical protein [Vibrio alginolyticus]MDW2024332.1 hypothetical protein [Vibrio sp. 397]MDW2028609.1 hypothetical protein [Vibrio sp. 399]MDW2214819.1 hypothetical protein [Vibrio sp. 1982]